MEDGLHVLAVLAVVGAAQLPEILALVENAALAWRLKAQQQARHRALAAAALADNAGDGGAGGVDAKGKVAQRHVSVCVGRRRC